MVFFFFLHTVFVYFITFKAKLSTYRGKTSVFNFSSTTVASSLSDVNKVLTVYRMFDLTLNYFIILMYMLKEVNTFIQNRKQWYCLRAVCTNIFLPLCLFI